MEVALYVRRWILELDPQGLNYLQRRFCWVCPICLLHCVGDVSDYVREHDPPSSGLVVALGLPHAHVEAAVKPTLSNPTTNHLDGVLVSLGCRWNYESLHRGLTPELSRAAKRLRLEWNC